MANGQAVIPSIKRKDQKSSRDVHALPERPEQISTLPEVPNGGSNGVSLAPTDGFRSPHPVLDPSVTAFLEGQRKDIDRIMTNVENLQQEMKTVKASMEYLKFQQQTFATFNDHDIAKSPTSLTEDLHELTERVSHVSTKVNKVDALSEGLNVLTAKVSQIGTGVNEVDGLKLELKLMKRRIKRLENTNIGSQVSNLASKSEGSFGSEVQRKSEPIHMEISQEVPSSTRSQSEHTSARLGRSESTLSLEENGLEYVSDSAPDKPRQPSQYSDDRQKTPESNLVELLRPQITSAEKVAAQKRRRSRDSSTSSSSSVAVPSTKRPIGRLRIHGKPDWNTKPRLDASAKRKLTSLNDPEHVLTSDPEDSDYDPSSLPQDYDSPHAKEMPRVRSKPPLRLPTPEWEKPDWENPFSPPTSISTRGRSTARRGVSGRGAIPDRNSFHRRSSGYANGDYVYAQSPDYWDDDDVPSARRHSGTPDHNFFAKPRDSKGRLLRPDGRVDGRSLRHQRERAERAKLAALEQQLKASGGEQQLKTATVGEQRNEVQAMAPKPRVNYVDAAALAAAGFGTVPKSAVRVNGAEGQTSADQPSTDTAIKNENDAAGPSAPAGTAPAIAAPSPSGGDAHAKIMKQMFPWR
ncbi:MAG: hypothetical protein Q9225_007806 [Loekoesia sp. 1 TL-2023]